MHAITRPRGASQRRGATALAAVSVAALLITGCSGGGTDDGEIVLEYWDLINPAGDDPRGRDLAANIAEFEESHPGVTIKVNTLPWATIDSELMQAANSGKSPDIVRVLAWDLPKHIAAGNLAPLDDLIPADDDWLLGWETLSSADAKWALPFEYRSPALYYQTGVAGEERPDTWDDMVDTAEDLAQDNGKSAVVVGLSTGGAGAVLAEMLVSYLWAEGAEVFNEDGTAAFNSPEGVRAFERVGRLVPAGLTPSEVVSYTVEEVTQAVTVSSANYYVLGSHRYAAAAEAGGLDDLAIAPLPGVEPGTTAPAHVNGWTLALGKDGDDPEVAAEFIAFMTSPEVQLRRVQTTAEMPTRASVYDDPWFETEDGAPAKILADWFAQNGRTLDYGEHYVEMSILWAEALQKMALEGADAKTVADEAAAAYNALL